MEIKLKKKKLKLQKRIFAILEVSCAYKKENIRQEILQRDDTIAQDNLATMILFSHQWD